jgi:phosphoribosylaminoimidazolecarboxamide formyltransferase/IMP cyclohydrolase
MRALISVYDKAGVADFARGLAALGAEIVASGGTATHLEEHGVEVTRIETLTGFAELLGHRVVTLHPAVHGGILARRDVATDLADLAAHGIAPFDLVCVNLYPFGEHETVEMIDIGGPAMLRGAAKNFAHVAAVSRPEQYEGVLDELRRDSSLSLETRRRLAADAFASTALYESAIAAWFAKDEPFPDRMTIPLEKVSDLAYGENPHQRAALYARAGGQRHVLSHVEQLHGKPLSYNNLNDLAAARRLLDELTGPACVIVKHANPCGAALGESAEEAYEGALASDPVSAYGGVVVVNRPVSDTLGGRLAEQFVEVLLAPGYQAGALDTLSVKPAVRILLASDGSAAETRDYRSVLGGMLVQDADLHKLAEGDLKVVSKRPPTPEEKRALVFAWKVCKHVTSNAILYARDGQTVGVGAGQMSRVDSCKLGAMKAQLPLKGTVAASDAFFPFPDGVEEIAKAGATAIIQPGGSVRDQEVIEAADRLGLAMIFTGVRHFRH